MITTLLLDLDGVLRLWDPRHTVAVEETYALPDGALREAAASTDALEAALTGAMDDGSWRAAVADALVGRHGEPCRPAVEAWMEPAGSVDAEALEIVRRARRNVRVVLLANATSRLEDDLGRLGLTDELDDVISSADLGLAKPDPDVFGAVALRYRALFRELACVDASIGSIAAAEILGVRAHHYQGVEGLEAFVEEIAQSTRVHC